MSALTNRTLKNSSRSGWGHDSHGRLTTCKYCRQTIYMHENENGRWRPFESWVAGACDEGDFILHDCRTVSSRKIRQMNGTD